MNIFIVRHAETELNNQGIIQGSDIDTEINKNGMLQSNKFFYKYKKYPFQKIYISKLRRTYQSIIKFIELGIPYEKLEGLNEISWGEKQGENDDIEEYKNLINSWSNGNLSDRFINGESPLDVMERQKNVFKKIIKDNFKNILICTHGRGLRIMLSWLLNSDLRQMNRYPHTNLGLYILKFENKIFRIVKKNDISHLSLRNHLFFHPSQLWRTVKANPGITIFKRLIQVIFFYQGLPNKYNH